MAMKHFLQPWISTLLFFIMQSWVSQLTSAFASNNHMKHASPAIVQDIIAPHAFTLNAQLCLRPCMGGKNERASIGKFSSMLWLLAL